MSAIITDQFRINNATNFVNSILDSTNAYYMVLGLCNPKQDGFGRDNNWQEVSSGGIIPNPTDNLNYVTHYKNTALFGKRVTSSSVRRVIKKNQWVVGRKYDMYRHDYSNDNPSPISNKSRLYDCNYYVVNSDYRVYICLYNGSSGDNLSGNASQDEPNFIDFEPSKAGNSGDGYIWKYLFTIPPSDIVKFDSTEYIALPNNWDTSTDSQIESIRENGDSIVNNNQLKIIYIKNRGNGYTPDKAVTVDIVGDGTGGKAFIEVNSSGRIENATIIDGGSGYTYAIVDLGPLRPQGNFSGTYAELIPIIPPSLGHGYDIYQELGADRVLLYSRFDDSSLDFPTDTKFSQVSLIKNPSEYSSKEIYYSSQFSNLFSLKLINVSGENNLSIGDKIYQDSSKAVGYVASYNQTTGVLKYFKDRSLYYGGDGTTTTDYLNVSTDSDANTNFISGVILNDSGFEASIDESFTGTIETIDNQSINLESTFTSGVSLPEINSKTGDVIYIDNRPLVTRNLRQKEDVKIILEF